MALPSTGTGSGIVFNPAGVEIAPRITGSNNKAEINRLRRQLRDLLKPGALLHCQEYVNPVAAVTNALVTAVTAPFAAALVYQKGSSVPLNGSVASSVMPFGRNVTVTTVGADSEFNFPFNVTVEGLDVLGQAISEVITVAAAASPGTIAGSKIFSSVTKVTIPAATGINGSAGTIALGFGAVLGLPSDIAAGRGGSATPKPIQEVAAGTVVTTGTFSATNRSYTPASAPNGSTSYYVLYEADAGAILARIPQLPAVDPQSCLPEQCQLLPTQTFPILGASA